MTRTKRRPELVAAVRDSMLDAATRVFASKGYAAATMKDIAVEANYTAAAFYNYFEGKEELFEALVERTTQELLKCFEPLQGDQPLQRRVEVLTRRVFALVDRRGETLSLLESLQNGAAGTSSARVAKQQFECSTKAIDRLCVWLGGSDSRQDAGRDTMQQAALFYLGVIRALHASWLRERSTELFEDQTDVAVDLFLHGFIGRTKPVTGSKAP